MLNDLLLLSGNEIPFTEAQLTIHQPTIKEIAYISEESFYTGCEFLNFSKDILSEEDRIHLEDKSNFEILMSIMREQNVTIKKNRACVLLVMALLFPEYSIEITNSFVLKKDDKTFEINNNNFEIFKEIINSIFCLKDKGDDQSPNPSGEMAKRIADKLRKRHEKLAELKNQKEQKVAILSRFVSILAVGENKDMNSLLGYTVYQLFDEFKRYELKMNNDIYLKAKLAGAQDLKEVEDWMKDIHE